MVLSTVVPTSLAGVDSFVKIRFRFIAGHPLLLLHETALGGGMMSHHLIWLLSFKLGSWSCQLWYQHSLWVFTCLTKWDSGLLLEIFQYFCGKQKQGVVVSLHFIDCLVLNWDHGLIHCGTNFFRGWLCWQYTIQVYCWKSFHIVAENRNMGERWCLAISFDCLALNRDCGLVDCGTNILWGCWLFW